MLCHILAMNHNEWMINAEILKKLNFSIGKLGEFSVCYGLFIEKLIYDYLDF